MADSVWRCDGCGETILAAPVVIRDGEVEGPLPPDVDVAVVSLPCPLCSTPMRRIVSLFDHRDWADQFAFAEPSL